MKTLLARGTASKIKRWGARKLLLEDVNSDQKGEKFAKVAVVGQVKRRRVQRCRTRKATTIPNVRGGESPKSGSCFRLC